MWCPLWLAVVSMARPGAAVRVTRASAATGGARSLGLAQAQGAIEIHPNREDLLDKIMIIPEHKLLFCWIDKVAGTAFNDLFLHVRSKYEPEQARFAQPYTRFHHNDMDHFNWTEAQLIGAIKSDEWHKAVFYRDPVERFASGYASKCLGDDSDIDGRRRCKEMFGSETVPFDTAVETLNYYSEHFGSNDTMLEVHWRRQSDYCGGLSWSIKYYQTVVQLDRETARMDVEKLLDKVGINPQEVPQFDELFPPPEDTEWTEDPHNKNTSGELEEYYPADQPQLLQDVVRFYEQDYRTFGLRRPTALSDVDGSALLRKARRRDWTTPRWPLHGWN